MAVRHPTKGRLLTQTDDLCDVSYFLVLVATFNTTSALRAHRIHTLKPIPFFRKDATLKGMR